MKRLSKKIFNFQFSIFNWLALILIFFGAAARLIPHPPNVAPIGALAIFGGRYLSGWAINLPILALFISDAIIGFYTWQVMASVYLGFAIAGLLSYAFIRPQPTVRRITSLTLFSSLLFYLITNFSVWAWTPLYPKTLPGLYESYVMALPFFRNSLIGDLLYTGLLFGMYEWSKTFLITLKFKTHNANLKMTIQN